MSFYAQSHGSVFQPKYQIRPGVFGVNYTCMCLEEFRRQVKSDIQDLNKTLGHDCGTTEEKALKDLLDRVILENRDDCPKPSGQKVPCGVYHDGHEFEIYPEDWGLPCASGLSLTEAFANAQIFFDRPIVRVSDDANNSAEYNDLEEATEAIDSWFDYLDEFELEKLGEINMPDTWGELPQYAHEVGELVAQMLGHEAFHGHGSYHVSASNRAGTSLHVQFLTDIVN